MKHTTMQILSNPQSGDLNGSRKCNYQCQNCSLIELIEKS
jgi:hypothetical protein